MFDLKETSTSDFLIKVTILKNIYDNLIKNNIIKIKHIE